MREKRGRDRQTDKETGRETATKLEKDRENQRKEAETATQKTEGMWWGPGRQGAESHRFSHEVLGRALPQPPAHSPEGSHSLPSPALPEPQQIGPYPCSALSSGSPRGCCLGNTLPACAALPMDGHGAWWASVYVCAHFSVHTSRCMNTNPHARRFGKHAAPAGPTSSSIHPVP